MELPRLSTPRLLLRPFSRSDAPVVTDYLQEPEISTNTARIPHPYRQNMAEEWIDTHEREFADSRELSLAITLVDDSRLIGAVGLVLDLPNRAAEIGYWLGKPWWGRGFASEAAQRTLDWGFETLELNRIHAGYMAHNPASGGVLTKLGMQHEGLRREHFIRHGRPVDLVVTGLLRKDWIARRNGARPHD